MAILVMPTQVTALGFLRLITNMGMDDSLLPEGAELMGTVDAGGLDELLGQRGLHIAVQAIPIVKGIMNSLIVSGCCAAIVTYFSSLTAYGIYAYDFKLWR